MNDTAYTGRRDPINCPANAPDPRMKTTRMPDFKCLRCRAKCSAATYFYGQAVPKPGDVSICVKCGNAAIFADDLTVRKPTPEEAEAILHSAEVLKHQLAVASLPSKKPKKK